MSTNANYNLDKILQDALSGDMALRSSAEDSITHLADENFGLFLLNLSIKISNEEVAKQVRQISATIIKNMISKPKYKEQWNKLDVEQKQNIKQHILSTLASSDSDIRKAAGLSIAGICKVELPKQQWLEIFNILVGTSQNNNLYIQLSSVITLGYIFQEVSENDIPDNQIANILDCFYKLLSQDNLNEELQFETLTAMEYLLPFISKFLQDENQKILLFNLIKKFTTHQAPKIRTKTLQIFVELVRNYYDIFNTYVDQLIDFTTFLLEKDEEKNKLLCYEIWFAIGDTETNRLKKQAVGVQCYRMCEKARTRLLPIFLSNLLTKQYISDEWTISQASSFLLGTFSTCCEYELIQKVIDFIGQNIQSTDLDLRHSALLAFSSILETVHHNNLIDIVKNSLTIIVSYLTDESSPDHIKDVSAYVIERIAKYYGNEIAEDKNTYEKLFNLIVDSMKKYKRKIVVRFCNILHFLIRAVKWEEGQNTNILSSLISKTLSELITLAFAGGSYNAENNVALSCFYALGTLVERAATDTATILKVIFSKLIEAFESTLNPKNFPNEEMREAYQSYISTSMSTFLVGRQMEEQQIKKLYQLIILSFQQKKKVYDQGITAIGGIAHSMGTQFDEFMTEFCPYLILSLRSTGDVSLCHAGILCTSDIIVSLKTSFGKYIEQLLPLIIQILSDNDIDKSLKPISFLCISDLFYSCPKDVSPYFNNIMNLIGTALKAAIIFTPLNDDIDTFEYFKRLREHLIETISCIFFAIQELHREMDFTPFVQPIMEFINKVNSPEYNPSYELVKGSIGLIGDLCNIYKGAMKNMLDTNIIQGMVAIIKKIPKEEDQNQMNLLIAWVEKTITEALNSK